jgi:hypothetical protein
MNPGVGYNPLEPCADCGHLCSAEAQSCPNCGKPCPRQPNRAKGMLGNEIYTHILNQSSMKIGMCLTLLGLIKVVEGVKNVTSIVDELLAIDAVGFLISSIATYYALKQAEGDSKRRAGKIGDMIFTLSLLVLAVICGVLAFELL